MGIQLVSVVLAEHTRVSDRAFRVLVRMAAQALDTKGSRGQEPGLFFGGWEPLALALGRDVPSDEQVKADPKARRQRDLVRETVRRAIAELLGAGVIEQVHLLLNEDGSPRLDKYGHPLTGARTGTRQTYRLTLSPTATVPLSPPESTTPAVPLSQESPTAAVPLSPTATVGLFDDQPHRHGGESPTATVPPRKKKEPEGREDLLQDRNLDDGAHLTERARATTDDQSAHISEGVGPHPFRGAAGGPCSECGGKRFAHAGWGVASREAG